MLDTTASAKKKSKKMKEISFQGELPSLGPSKPLEKITYQSFAELYESSGESDLNSSQPNKIKNKNEVEKSYRSMVFHNKSRGGKENGDVKTPKIKKNRSISESYPNNGADTPVAKKKSRRSSNSEESGNVNASRDNSSVGKKKNKNKLLDLTYNPQVTSTPTTDALNKSKLINSAKDKSVVLNDSVQNVRVNSGKKNKKNKTVEDIAATETTPEKSNNKRDRKKSKSIENYVTPKKIKTDENRDGEIEDANEPIDKSTRKERKTSGVETAHIKNKEKKRKVLKSETESQERTGESNKDAVSDPKKKRKNRNKNRNAEREQKDDETEPERDNEDVSDNEDVFANAQPVTKKNKVKTAPKEGKEKPDKKGKNKKKTNNREAKEGTEEVGEKSEKSTKKWNKHNKHMAQGVHIAMTTLFVENLPLNLMLKYKPLLKEQFGKYGPIRNFGIIELYPTEDPRPVFSTTVRFHNEDSAEKALLEDNTVLGGKRIRVRPMLPAKETTVVAKGKGLTEQAVSTIFAPCGRLRSIRIVIKGKHSKYRTAFVEFNGPEAVAKALKVAPEASVAGKPVVVSRFEPRVVAQPPTRAVPADAAQERMEASDEGESEDDD